MGTQIIKSLGKTSRDIFAVIQLPRVRGRKRARLKPQEYSDFLFILDTVSTEKDFEC